VDLLLDTKVFLWWEGSSRRLRTETASLLSDEANRVFVSAASIWEIAIKRRIGKLAFEGSPADAVLATGFFEAPILGSDAEVAGGLDWDHSDPFDRLIVAQAVNRRLTLVTADSEMRRYGGVAQLRA
jgi:PIN domain nuclease of toxin-antitoxin system